MNITKTTFEFIDQHPSIKDCVMKGIVNYSALSRFISRDLGLDPKKHFDAVVIACRRYYAKVKNKEPMETKIKKLLAASRVEVKNKIVVAVVEKDLYYANLIELHREIKAKAEVFHIIEGSSTMTIITTAGFLEHIRRFFRQKIIKITENLAELNLKSSRELEQIPGVMAYLTSLLAGNGINIIETMSTWTDTLFVIDEKDVPKAMQVLRF